MTNAEPGAVATGEGKVRVALCETVAVARHCLFTLRTSDGMIAIEVDRRTRSLPLPVLHSSAATKIEGSTMKHSEGFLKLVNDAKSRVREVTVEQTHKRMSANPKAKLIDVREDNEWQLARAAGSIHLAKGIIERDIEELVPDKATELILYCGGGFRSALAADVLQQMGYTNVFSMAGGWKAWKESGSEVVDGS